MSVTPLASAVAALEEFYGTPPPPVTRRPFELILWENIAYLASDERRLQAFEKLRSTIGAEPRDILLATGAQLVNITAHGILSDQFERKLREAARLAIDEYGGSLDDVVHLPTHDAIRALRKFPGIGDPAAEKILLFTADRPFLAPDSNALRVMIRIGVISAQRNYSATYAEARTVSGEQLGGDAAVYLKAHMLLRRHGQTLCKRSAPACHKCPIRPLCQYAQTTGVTEIMRPPRATKRSRRSE
ncbi:MAG TPA: hypothetical protein VFV58_12325 [Blastocatellia bacterium]|jgi:endonuclease III|nr:hypothetical protein [Blastocatellia bacterium]